LRYTTKALFQDNTITNGPNTLWLETDCRDIKLQNSGNVSIGTNCSNVWVDGQQRA
jgi:hypothetical protein